MKRGRMVQQWECEYCGKRGFSPSHLSRHEKRCTANPDRYCGMCAWAEEEDSGEQQEPMEKLIAAAAVGLKELREVSNGCPACMLAAIRQWAARQPNPELAKWRFNGCGVKVDESGAVDTDEPMGEHANAFNYKKERDEFVAEVNNSIHERDCREMGY